MSVLLMGTPPRRRDIAEISSSVSSSSSSSCDTKIHNSCEEERVERGEGEEGVGETEGGGGGGGGGGEVADLEQEETIDGKEEFVLSPIVPLRDQLEKDKVRFCSLFSVSLFSSVYVTDGIMFIH